MLTTMNKLAVLFLLPLIAFSAGAQAQQMSVVTFTSAAAEPAPANVHEYALQEFKEFYDYASRNRVPDQFFMVHMSTFTFAGGTKQGFSIDKDGKVTLENMTLEDALLSTVAFQSRESLDRMKGCSHDLELHRTIYAMTPKLLKMLQENPDLVKYLTTPPVKPAEPKKDEVKR